MMMEMSCKCTLMETSNKEHGSGNLMQKAKYLRQVTQCLTMEMNCKAWGDGDWCCAMETNCWGLDNGNKLQSPRYRR